MIELARNLYFTIISEPGDPQVETMLKLFPYLRSGLRGHTPIGCQAQKGTAFIAI
jgi:hypothetical protein